MKHCFRQLPSRGQVSLFLQLHKRLGVVDIESTVALYCFIMLEMFFIQQQLNFRVLVLKILCSLRCLGKCFLTKFRNTFLILAFMLRLDGGLNHSILRCLFLLFVFSLVSYFISALYPLSLRAFSYNGLGLLNSSSLYERSDKRLLIILGRSFMMFGGWFDLALMYRGSLFGLQYRQYFSATRLKVTSRKSVSTRFVSMVIFNPSFLNKVMTLFLVLSSTGPLQLLIATRASSL